MKQGAIIWGFIDLAWHIVHLLLLMVIGLHPMLHGFYFVWYSVMIVIDILVIVESDNANPVKIASHT